VEPDQIGHQDTKRAALKVGDLVPKEVLNFLVDIKNLPNTVRTGRKDDQTGSCVLSEHLMILSAGIIRSI
jgi:hypothetical protein